MRLAFLGTGEIGLPSLRYLLAQREHEVVAVVTQPDKPVGRKLILTPPAVKVMAEAAGVPVYQPEKIRNFVAELKALDLDVVVVVAYGQLLSQAVLDVPKMTTLNLHASLLPRHRGASPIQAAILAGDALSGMSVMHVALGLDSGDVILTEPVALAQDETGGSLHDKLAEVGPRALERALAALSDGSAERHPQDETQVTHCRKLLREHGVLDWSHPAEELERKIRAFEPWPGTSTLWKGKLLKLFPPVQCEAAGGQPGTILEISSTSFVIACGVGSLRVQEIQLEGKRRMTAAEFLAGHPLAVGDKLG
jgi:methionyl-tRNA formyltransferase